MNWIAIVAYAIALFLNVRFFYYAYQAMILNSDGPSKSFYYGIQIDVLLLWIIGAAVAQFYLFLFWTSHFIIKSISTNKMVSRKNLLKIASFICFSLISQLIIISGTNIITQTDFRLDVLNIFFLNHGILTLGLFIVYPLFTMMKYGIIWPKLKMDLAVCLVFSLLSLVSFGFFQIFILFHILNHSLLSVVLLFSLLIIYNESKKLKNELLAYKMDEPVNEFSATDPKMQVLTNLIDQSDFRDLRKISKKRVIQQQDATTETYEIPKECPYCKNPLPRSAFCEICNVKICPKCFSKVSEKIQQCTCGYLFRISTQKPHLKEAIQQDASEKIPQGTREEGFKMKKDGVQPSEEKIQIEGTIPRLCPYCGAIGWKEDICRCGYDYVHRVFLHKKDRSAGK